MFELLRMRDGGLVCSNQTSYKMKKHIICATLFMAMAFTSAQAQNFKLGVSAGIDAARMAISGASGGPLKYRTEVVGGLHGELELSRTVGLQLEVNYAAQGAGLASEDLSSIGSYQLNYITVPLLVKLYGTPRLSFFAGPQAGFLLSAKMKSAGQGETDAKDQFKSTDFYGVFGAEYRFDNGIFISGRYNASLSNSFDVDEPGYEVHNRYFSFRIGYAFSIGK